MDAEAGSRRQADGAFVHAEIIDHQVALDRTGGEHVLDDRQRRALERRWIADQLIRRGPTRVRSILARRRRERSA